MLQKLNERIQGFVAWLIILIIAITFTLFGVDYYLQSHHQTSDVKVLVNEVPIRSEAFESNYRRTRAQQDMAQMTAIEEKNLKNQVLNQMIMNEVTVQSAHRHGFAVSSEQANAAIVRIPQFLVEGHFSTQKYQQALSGALFTAETFQNEVKQGMLLNQLRFAFMGSSFALPAEIKRFVRLYMQTRDYDYVVVMPSQFKTSLQVSKESIAEYYKNHSKEFMAAEQLSIDYVKLSMEDILSKVKISNEEIKRYYDENQNNFLSPAKWRVAHILFALPQNSSSAEADQMLKKAQAVYEELQKNPEHFDALVLSLSDDKLSLTNKGILPWISADQSEYSNILATLTTPGQILTPQKTKHGYEIFKLLALKSASTQTVEQVEPVIKEQLLADITQKQYSETLEKLSDLSYQNPDSLSSVAESLHLKIQHSDLFSKFAGTDAVTQNKKIINAAFSHEVLDLGNNSDPIQLNNDSVIVLRVKDHVLASQQPLTAVYKQIEELLIKKQAESKAKEIGARLLNPMEDQVQQDLMSANQLQWQTVVKASRDNEKSNSAINNLAFNLLKPDSRDGIVLANGDYVVVRLKRINEGELKALDQEQKNSLIQQIESSYGMLNYELYVNRLMKHAQIVRN